VSYTGAVPDPFRVGRELIVDRRQERVGIRRRVGIDGHEVSVEVQPGEVQPGEVGVIAAAS